jgi:hypothetical protein
MKSRLLLSLLFCAMGWAGFAQVTSVGIIGTATPGGWGADTYLTQSPDSAHLWSINLDLVEGECKFRANGGWDVNWGSNTFPAGIGTQGGSNIQVPAAGLFSITFNSNTGDYFFGYTSDIGIIGDATPNGWSADTDMYQNLVDTNKYFITLNLIGGKECKFRADNDWAINWGGEGFPQDTGYQGGPNIKIPATGKYRIDFDKATGDYKFEEILEFSTIGLIGSATPYGWDKDTSLVKDSGNPALWKGIIDLVDGEAKFRANDAWTISWGDTLFPSGIGILNGMNIPVTAGRYIVSFNTSTFAYNFQKIEAFTSIGIIGSATPGGWDNETSFDQDPADETLWKKRLILTDGEAKFRANNDWAVNWGAGDFPEGVGEQDGANIPVAAGEYKISFNSVTGEYKFEVLVIFSTVGIVGPASPSASWDVDFDLNKDAVDEQLWTLPSATMTDGECKFRAEDGWAVNWGLAQWPSGIGTQDGPNIPVTGGTYRVTLRTDTGEYAFTEPSSTTNLLDGNAIRVMPNPATDILVVNVEAKELKGDAQVILFNQMGQRVKSLNLNLASATTINVADVLPGNYMLHISNGKYIVGKSVVIVR